tara:strand:+ start:3069 stop:3935 length:867 start_codon:yes stop_codon:yes gene_type:complete
MKQKDYLAYQKEARALTLLMIYTARSGHPGGSLSVIDILSVLANEFLEWDENYKHEFDKNALILSKGHACPALYAVAAMNGLINKDEITSFRKINSRLQGHPDVKQLPWLGSSTGSLGQGFSVGIGNAIAAQNLGVTKNVFTILGDGELQEGQIWEGAMVAAHHNVSNLCAIIDYNKMQSDDLNINISNLEPLGDKWSSFGWNVIEINGHDINEIYNSIDESISNQNMPSVIIANTIKGKGVKYMENVPKWHGSVTMSYEELELSFSDIGYEKEEFQSFLNKYGVNKL